MHVFRLDFVAIVHDHFCMHSRRGSESNTDQYNPIAGYPAIDDRRVPLDVARGMCSITAKGENKGQMTGIA